MGETEERSRMDCVGFLREDIKRIWFRNEGCSWRVGCCGQPLFLWKIAEKSDILSYVKRNNEDSRIIVVAGTEKCKCERRMEHEVLVV